ncbi:hypothetical protein E1B28_004493 [Marasmius oreades]|uniref:Ubiquitin-like domain-containing protein n=1 Tax=Marasmius oreades TaxID=181124 RepID=A0A9P7UYU2_9AGAR|nr:uncharacterized protein E1B28_004493 [Marasmius oreades]KAG7097115.1 hypothetical protein E1B28_004493 [Marasmius oreades]
MSTVQLRVELPTYAQSFTIQVPDISTIRDVKQKIFTSCPGAPQVAGQKIIWRGRYLSDDEKLEDIWKSPDEPRIIHLSVHPSAWTSHPPTASTSSTTGQPQLREQPTHPAYMTTPVSSSSMFSQQNPTHTRTTPSSFSQSHPLAYVLQKHHHALGFLTKGKSNHIELSEIDALRTKAVRFVEVHGYQWPSILDEPFPSTTDGGGILYEHTVIGGQSYLRLRNSWEKPTEAQMHALKVLSYTFVLLKLPPEPPRRTSIPLSEPVAIPPNLHALLQQMGLPPVQGDAEHHRRLLQQLQGQRPNPILNGNERVIEINLNLRPFLLPLFMLAFRTLLLLYFVAPARKPIFSILLIAWVLYEIWQPIRNAFMRGAGGQQPQRRDGEAGGARDGGNQNQNRDQPQANPAPEGARPQNQPNPPPATPRNREIGATGALVDAIASCDVQSEEAELTRGDVDEPGLKRKAYVFVTLFLATVHPAVWNRRRVALRQREGRIRTEERARNSSVEPEGAGEGQDTTRDAAAQDSRERLQAQYARRRPWIQRYIQRVMREEWVDDSD